MNHQAFPLVMKIIKKKSIRQVFLGITDAASDIIQPFLYRESGKSVHDHQRPDQSPFVITYEFLGFTV